MAVAKQISFLLNGYELACALKSFSIDGQTAALDSTVLCNDYKSFEPGFQEGDLAAEGLWRADTVDADEIDDVLKAAFASGGDNVITASLGVISIGSAAVMLAGPEIKYAIKMPTAELIMVMADFKATNGLAFGKWQLNSQLNAGTTNAANIDNGVATSNGGVFHVHLQNLSSGGATDVDVKLQHSSNGSSWSDLSGAAVNNLSAVHAAGSVTVAPGTAVSRYTRAVAVVTGGNTVLVSAAFARR